jgi:transposase
MISRRPVTNPDCSTGLAEFALVQSYLSTAAKWDISKLDALRGLFNGQPWLPPSLEPTG